MCWRLIKNAGIDQVVFIDDDPESRDFNDLMRVNAQDVILAHMHPAKREEC
jgi:tRNA(Arg) A34 adenosine deaminase TadA